MDSLPYLVYANAMQVSPLKSINQWAFFPWKEKIIVVTGIYGKCLFPILLWASNLSVSVSVSVSVWLWTVSIWASILLGLYHEWREVRPLIRREFADMIVFVFFVVANVKEDVQIRLQRAVNDKLGDLQVWAKDEEPWLALLEEKVIRVIRCQEFQQKTRWRYIV